MYDVADALGPIAAGVLVATAGYARVFQILSIVGVTTAAAFLACSRAERGTGGGTSHRAPGAISTTG